GEYRETRRGGVQPGGVGPVALAGPADPRAAAGGGRGPDARKRAVGDRVRRAGQPPLRAGARAAHGRVGGGDVAFGQPHHAGRGRAEVPRSRAQGSPRRRRAGRRRRADRGRARPPARRRPPPRRQRARAGARPRAARLGRRARGGSAACGRRQRARPPATARRRHEAGV
ncbi:MAG: Transcriptional regulator, MarR family, partial [uncultured Rubrobacteraceae bacterium]